MRTLYRNLFQWVHMCAFWVIYHCFWVKCWGFHMSIHPPTHPHNPLLKTLNPKPRPLGIELQLWGGPLLWCGLLSSPARVWMFEPPTISTRVSGTWLELKTCHWTQKMHQNPETKSKTLKRLSKKWEGWSFSLCTCQLHVGGGGEWPYNRIE